ncbi:MAG: potassium-transporting ATPase subunit C [Nocardioidaceae bacterium]
MKDLYTLARHSVAGLIVLLALTVILGLAYPFAVAGVAALTMPWQAQGSYVTASGEHTTDPGASVGSEIIGQLTNGDPALFQSRPSAAGDGYDPLNTYGSNLGPLSEELVTSIEERKAEVAEREGADASDVPPDAVTASASGLDPHISVAYAELQVPRVAAETGLGEQEVRDLVDRNTTSRALGFLGEPAVNVLMLNLAVRAASP